jgi:hypothetical protein
MTKNGFGPRPTLPLSPKKELGDLTNLVTICEDDLPLPSPSKIRVHCGPEPIVLDDFKSARIQNTNSEPVLFLPETSAFEARALSVVDEKARAFVKTSKT